MSTVNVYDFDHTIYDGDASLDFIVYCLSRDVRLWVYLPVMVWALLLYVLGFRNRKQLKQSAFGFLKRIRSLDEKVDRFWKSHNRKIKKLFNKTKADINIVISASPEFLLNPVAEALGVELIATKMNQKTGDIVGKNCRGEEKVARLQKAFPSIVIDEAYSDSLSDTALLQLSKTGYIVSKEKIVPLKDYKFSPIKRFKSVKFLRFLFVGGINALIGILLAYVFSLFIASPQVAFAIGFAIGLIPSYFLNSVITFRDKVFTLKKYGSFVISYIPNFVVMFSLVHIFTEILGLYPLLTYTLALMIAVPITFTLLSIITFREKAKS